MSRRWRIRYVPLLALLSASALLNACNTATPTPPQKTEIVSYTFSPPSPAVLKHGEYVTAELSYVSGHSTPLRMWAQIEYAGPVSDGTSSYCPSPAVVAKQGVVERCFRIKDAHVDGVPAPVHVDTIELKIVDEDQTVELFQELVTVDYTWEP